MSLASNITRRSGSSRYYARQWVPKELQGVLKKAEVWKSLGTSDPKEAKKAARLVLLKKAHNHWKGFVFNREDGSRMLIGKDCGRLHYGADYDVVKQGFDRYKARQMDLHIIYKAYPMLLQLSDALTGVADHFSYKLLHQARDGLESQMDVLFKRLRGFARGDRKAVILRKKIPNEFAIAERRGRNKLVREELATLSKREKRYLEEIGKLPKLEDESKPLTKEVEVGSFPLKGANFFLDQIEPHCEKIRGSVRLAKALYLSLQNRDSDSLTSGLLMRECAALARLSRQALTAMEQISAMSQFFEQTHLEQVAAWANGYDGDGVVYETRPKGLIRKGGPNFADIGLPTGFALPDDSFIRNFGIEVSGSIKAIAA